MRCMFSCRLCRDFSPTSSKNTERGERVSQLASNSEYYTYKAQQEGGSNPHGRSHCVEYGHQPALEESIKKTNKSEEKCQCSPMLQSHIKTGCPLLILTCCILTKQSTFAFNFHLCCSDLDNSWIIFMNMVASQDCGNAVMVPQSTRLSSDQFRSMVWVLNR